MYIYTYIYITHIAYWSIVIFFYFYVFPIHLIYIYTRDDYTLYRDIAADNKVVISQTSWFEIQNKITYYAHPQRPICKVELPTLPFLR